MERGLHKLDCSEALLQTISAKATTHALNVSSSFSVGLPYVLQRSIRSRRSLRVAVGAAKEHKHG